MPFDIHFEVTASLFLILLLIISSTRKRLEGFVYKTFRFYTIICLLNNVVDIAATYMLYYYNLFPRWLHWAANGYFFVMQFIIPTIFLSYVYGRISKYTDRRRRWFVAMFLPALIGVMMTLSTYVTHLIFYLDDTGYHPGNLHGYLYFNSAAYAVISLIFAIVWKNELEREFIHLVMMIASSALPVLLQMFFPHYLLAGVGTALCIYVMYLTSENQYDFFDQITGAYNKDAFIYELDELYKHAVNVNIYVIALDKFKTINEIYGMDGGNEMLKMLAKRLKAEFGDTHVFRYDGDIFAVTTDGESSTVKSRDIINYIFRTPFDFNGLDVLLSACVCLVHSGNHTSKRIFSAIEYGVATAKAKGRGSYIEVERKAVDTLERKAAIEQALTERIEQGSFEVNYQPIVDAKTMKVVSLEALARLEVPDYGYVSPDEFIGIAERNGTIVQLGKIVIEEVCKFINEENLIEKGIRYVELNLSVVQCMRERLYKDIFGILEGYGIPPQMINLEITEASAAYSGDRLIRNMARLSMKGITFSLDEYGSGKSNISYLIDMPFKVVKIDKSMIWKAMKKADARIVLGNTIKMFKELNKLIVAEGIENREMADMVTELGADYIQGYYYSQPVKKEEIPELLGKINREVAHE